jgi:hypothetical protein
MDRRRFIQGLGGVATSLKVRAADGLSKPVSSPGDTASLANEMPTVVAGIRLIDSKVAQSATRLARSVYPPYLFNHAMRTYIFGALIGIAHGHRFDKETLYLACVLHDLGLTESFEGDLPFEIQGAEATRKFLSAQGVPNEKIDMVWDGIALHASAVSDFKRPEIALVGAGAGADVVGPQTPNVTKSQTAETLKAYPRLGFKGAFLKTCAEVVQRHPDAATRSFMRDVGERFVPAFRPRNICDLIKQAPFRD